LYASTNNILKPHKYNVLYNVYPEMQNTHPMITRSRLPTPDYSNSTSHMVTRMRSGAIKQVTYDVNIDFDEASDAWRANKKSVGNGMFKYVGMRTRSSSKA